VNFNSTLFLLYFLPAFFLVYFLLPGKTRNWFLLFAGILFYSWGAPRFLPLLVISVVIDYFLLKDMQRREGSIRSMMLWVSVVMNVGLLFYFKYMNFFIDQVNAGLGMLHISPLKWFAIALPVGISFITFQKLACTFDVYRKTFPGFRSLADYATYIFMFPQLLAGPIIRPGQIAYQIRERRDTSTIDHRLTGFIRFIIGLSKKVLIADVLGITANSIFNLSPSELSCGVAWMGAITYSFQIYFDFSGYSDMAIGLALMLGFKLPENFNSPYLSRSITGFWRRWHITLSYWLRDYIFLPLAYSISRKLPGEKYAGIKTENLIYISATLVTFFLCGLWHGAGWNFIAWGVYQGIFLIFDRLFLLRFLKRTGKVPSILITFLFVTIGWVIFRSTIPGIFLGKMFLFKGGINDIWFHPKFRTVFALAVIFSFWSINGKIEKWIDRLYHAPSQRVLICMTLLSIVLFIICETNITGADFSPFIYFRF
jgi:alginate O-acetyltransferase complex protein AlgI